MADYSSQIVQKLWNYCNVLRDDGMSYDDYVEQLTYLLFLKMADERTKAPYVPAFGAHKPTSIVPEEYGWAGLIKRDGDELFDHYRHLLEELAKEKGLLALIFNKSQNKFQDPAKLRRLIVDLIDKENWSMMSADVKGDAYEGLLEKNGQDVKTGAGQYFTPRPLIAGIVDVMAPKPGETVCDPACGTGVYSGSARLRRESPSAHDHRRKEEAQGEYPQGHRAGAGSGAALCDESFAARYRQPGVRADCRNRLVGRGPRRAV